MNTIPERIAAKTEIFRKMLDQFGAELRVASPGIIQSFDSAKQTVTVQIAIREKINIDGVLSWREVPILVDVPIFMPRSGGYIITLPINKGDECLVIFGDNCMDAWWQSGGAQNQIDKRRHDLSDGFAIIGIWNQTKTIEGYAESSIQVRNEPGDTYIEISDKTINLVADAINITARNNINVHAQSNIDIAANNNTVIEKRNFVTHEHILVQTGKDDTGPVL